MSDLSVRLDQLSPAKRALLALELSSSGVEGDARAEPIAVIGMGCRFPGGADSPEAYWRLLRDGVDAVTTAPASRWTHPVPPPIGSGDGPDHGAFLDGIDRFDCGFFGIAPREAICMDPQQRLLLEVAWEALERAGQTPDRLAGSRTGVFVGISNNEYLPLIQRADPSRKDVYLIVGNSLNGAAGRLSFVLGLRGPSMAIDTACSSSLVAIHQACQSLRVGEADLALAAGVNLMLTPEPTRVLVAAGTMAPDGRCKTFDAAADGYVRGEGCGVVVLKRLADAERDGDPVLAVLRGSAVGQDGHGAGLTVPNGAAQEALIREALERSGVPPAAVDYVEAHGTGTSLGDPIEVRALGAVLREGRAPDRPLVIGSVKTNIGHLEAAAGIAGLMKVVLALQHRAIPPHLHLRTLSPKIALDEIPAVVPTAVRAWEDPGAPRVAGVSSFGFTGTIAHVVVEEAPQRNGTAPAHAPADRGLLLPLSARSPAALRVLASRYRDHLAAEGAAAADVCYSAAVRRGHHDHRLAIAALDRAALIAGLDAWLRDERVPGLATGTRVPGRHRRIVFVFPGQGSQWQGMARRGMEREPAFAEALARCDEAIQREAGWSIVDELSAEPGTSRLDRIDVLQPTLFAVQVSLAALWRSLGIEPAAVVGHSMGEVAAAVVAGAISLPDAVRIVCGRSAIVRPLIGRGAMAAVDLPLDEAIRALAGYEDRVSAAASNGPSSTVLSGDPAAIEELLAVFEARGAFCRRVKVEFAAHSPQIDAVRDQLAARLAGLRPVAAAVPLHSTVTGGALRGPELDASYWARNLREPVLFWTALRGLIEAGHDLFLEISPHPILLSPIEQGLHHLGRPGAALGSLRSQEDERLAVLRTLGALYACGHPLDFERVHAAGGRFVPLPPYPFQGEQHWVPIVAPPREVPVAAPIIEHDPFLGRRVLATRDASAFEVRFTAERPSFLPDHRIHGTVVVPGSSHISMLLTAGEVVFGAGHIVLEDVYFPRALAIPDGEARELRLTLDAEADGRHAFRVASRDGSATEGTAATHATGSLRVEPGARASSSIETLDVVRARCDHEASGADFYREAWEVGYHLGHTFQWIDRMHQREGEALCRMRLPDAVDEYDRYALPPGFIDSCFQIVGATVLTDRRMSSLAGNDLYIPTRIGRLRFTGRSGRRLYCHAVSRGFDAGQNEITGDFRVVDENGGVVVEAEGMRLTRAPREALRAAIGATRRVDAWLFELEWTPHPRAEGSSQRSLLPQPRGSWVLLGDRTGVARALASRLEARGDRCVVALAADDYRPLASGNIEIDPRRSEHYRRLLDDAAPAGRLRGLVHLFTIGASMLDGADADLAADASLGAESALHALHALAARPGSRLVMVTRGVHTVGAVAAGGVVGAPLWGLGRVVALEQPDRAPLCIDLGRDPEDDEADELALELLAGDEEDRIALRGGVRFAARLARVAVETAADNRVVEASAPAGDRPFCLEIELPGRLDTLTLREHRHAMPGQGEVAIRVHAAGMNFLDVMRAMGIYPGMDPRAFIPLGGECAGTVIAVGPGVSGLADGDEVVGVAAGSFASVVTTPAAYVVRRPASLTPEEAVTIPLVFMTAHYALHHLGRMRAGERVLIHCASGGTGLAAVQLAQHAGLEVFATAGRPSKRAFLESLGVRHVFDSRSLDFAAGVLEHTGGRGVDLVLNSLTGDAIEKGLEVLAPYGRFLEIGKRDIYADRRLGLLPFKKSLSYFAIDLAGMFERRPEACAELLTEVMQLEAAGAIVPLPSRVWPIVQAAEAFRTMAQANHVGKIVLTVKDASATPIAPAARHHGSLRDDGIYLVTGGLGGLGLEVARWMVERGARHVALLGRSAPSASATAQVDALRAAGATVHVVRADVSDGDSLAGALAALRATSRPLVGVIHAAGVLDDGTLETLDAGRLHAVLAPKVAGAVHLDRLTREDPLDLFVLFSAAASLLGSPGQGSYAAANAFLDALAHARRAAARPALAINWSAWSGAGMAAAQSNRGARVAARGLGSLTPTDGLAALERVLGLPPSTAQVAVMPLDLLHVRQFYPQVAASPFLSRLAREARGASAESAAAHRAAASILSATPPERQALIEQYLKEEIAPVLMIAPGQIASDGALTNLGFDSLLSLELRNRLEAGLGLSLSPTLVWNHPTLADLGAHLLEQLGAGGTATAPDDATPSPLPAIVPAPGDRNLPFPMTDTQQAYWVGRGSAVEMGNVACHVYQEIEIDDLDLPRFERAWQRVIERHDMLRMIVLADGRQRILDEVPLYRIHVEDLRPLTAEARDESLGATRDRLSHQVVDPQQWPLFELRASRLSERRLRLHISVDTLVGDGWSFRIITRELDRFYQDPEAPLEPLTLRFRDYVLAERALESSPAFARSLEYWRSRLPTLPPPPELPLARSPSSLRQPRFVRRTGGLTTAAWQRFKARAEQASVTPSGALMTAFARVLGAWSASPRFTLNVPQFNRMLLHPEVGDIVGEFASFTLLAVDAPRADGFAADARRLHEQLWQGLAHHRVSGVRLLRELARLRHGAPQAAMPVVFTSLLSLGAVGRDESLIGGRGTVVHSITQTPQVWLDLQVLLQDETLAWQWDTVDDLFPAGLVDDMHAAFADLVERLAAQDVDPAWEQPALVPLPPAQHARRRAEERASDDERALPAVRVHDALLDRAAEAPDRAAVITSSRVVSYGELVQVANRLGRRLRALGARPDTLVAVLMDKGWEQVAAVLGILQAGAAYLPIDARLPAQRIAHLIERGETSLVITQRSVDDRLELPVTVRRLHVDDAEVAAESDAPLDPAQGPAHLAYVLFTSGSTGQPKGVMAEHRGLVNATLATNARFAVGANDRVLAVTALHHDMSAFDLFGVLGAGGAIVMPDADGARDPAHWADLMRRERVTLWNSVPAMMEMLLEHADDRPPALPGSLRLAFLGGDWIPLAVPGRLRAHVDGARVVSVGGPTETTLWNIWFPVEQVEPEWKSIPYGRPIPRTRYYVLDEALEERPEWVPGELCCAGVGVARGYWRDEARTAERFAVHPRTGERLYRTGDLGRLHRQGHIEFLGRVDFQLKIQGHRIEPGEIEFALARHPAVRAAVVTSHRNAQGQPSLVAYVVTDRVAAAATAITSAPTPPPVTTPGNDVLTDRIERLEFKLRRHGLRPLDGVPSIALTAPAANAESLRPFIERRSYRVHLPRAVPLASLGHLLAALRGVQVDGLPLPKYRYGSGGGLYPVQTYVAVQPGRVDGLDAGLYYHHPEQHRLVPIAPGAVLDRQIHAATNQALHDRSAFSIFLIGNREAIAPLYGETPAHHFMTLEAGAMAHLLESEAPACGIGLCQIGSLEFGGVRDLLGLGDGHVFLHCLVAGPIEAAADDRAALLRDWNAYQIAPPPAVTTPPPEAALAEQLKAFLRDRLPDYMVPPAFVFLRELPLSANGKIDRGALPAPDLSAASTPEPFVAPRTDTERRLAALWRELLAVDEISARHQFFDLGGNSVQAMQLIAKIRDAFGIAVSVRLLFSSPALEDLAAELDRLCSGAAPDSSPRRSDGDPIDAPTAVPGQLRFADAPLLALVSAGSIAPVDAAALFSLPDNVPQHLGWSRGEFVDAWCEGGLPHPFSILDTSHGRIAVLMLPRYTSDLYADRADLARVTLQGIETAGRLGARVVSLTGIVSSATDYGRDLAAELAARPELPRVTTGHATTAATVVLAVERLLADAGRSMPAERLAVIGLGSIGTGTLRLLLRRHPHPREIILCDVLSKAHQLEQVRDEVSARLDFRGRVRLVGSRGALPDDVYEASLVVGATNVPGVLDVGRLRPGTLIVDDSAPHCFSAEDALERLASAGDLLFTEGGMVRLPQPMTDLRHVPAAARARLDAAQLAIFSRVNPQELTGCVYSSLLSARTPSLPPTIGPVDLETCEAHYVELVRLGIGAAELHCEGFVGRYELPGPSIDRFRRLFGAHGRVSVP